MDRSDRVHRAVTPFLLRLLGGDIGRGISSGLAACIGHGEKRDRYCRYRVPPVRPILWCAFPPGNAGSRMPLVVPRIGPARPRIIASHVVWQSRGNLAALLLRCSTPGHGRLRSSRRKSLAETPLAPGLCSRHPRLRVTRGKLFIGDFIELDLVSKLMGSLEFWLVSLLGTAESCMELFLCTAEFN